MIRHFLPAKQLMLLILTAFAVSACMRDSSDIPIPRTGPNSGITLNLSIPGIGTTTTRNLSEDDEKKIESVYVLLFENSGNNQVIAHMAGEIVNNSPAGVYQIHVPLEVPSESYEVVVLGNCNYFISSAISLASADAAADGRNYFRKSELLPYLTRTQGNGIWTMVSPARAIPMYGQTTVHADQNDATINVSMIRMVASVDFKVSDPESLIYSITVYNPVINGHLYPNYTDPASPNLPANYDRNRVKYTRNISVGGVGLPDYKGFYYLFESPAGGDSTTQIYTNETTCFVLQLSYKGTNYYYRVDFISDGSFPGTVKGDFTPLLRNYKYTFDIREVSGPGYSSTEEAVANKSMPNNLNYTTHAIDEGGYENIVYDGEYVLAAGIESATFQQEGGTMDIKITTDYPSGWTASVDGGSLDIFRISSGSASNTGVVWQEDVSRSRASVMGLKCLPGIDMTERTGTITVTAGRLTLKIALTRSADSVFKIEILDINGQNVDFLSFGYENVEPANFLIKWTPEDSPLLVSRTEIGSRGGFVHDFGSNDMLDNVTELTGGGAILTVVPPLRDMATEGGTYCTEYSFAVNYGTALMGRKFGLIQSVPQKYSALANCYMVSPATQYGGNQILIPVEQANRTPAATPTHLGVQIYDNTPLRAEVLWTDVAGINSKGVLSELPGISGNTSDVPVDEKYIMVTPGEAEGNALIGIYNNATSGGTLLWTWHIWVTPYQPGRGGESDPGITKTPKPTANSNTEVPNGLIYRYKPYDDGSRKTDNIFMDRNLGAVGISLQSDNHSIDYSTAEKREATFGLHYQWGRKSPLPGAAGYAAGAGTEKQIYNSAGTPISTGATYVPNNTGSNQTQYYTNHNYSSVSRSPLNFYYNDRSSGNTYDWYSSKYNSTASNAANIRWDKFWDNSSGKSVDDPCPPGWRVPRSSPTNSTSSSALSGNSTGKVPNADRSSYPDVGWDNNYSPWYGKGTNNATGSNGGYYFGPSLGWYPAAGFRPSRSGVVQQPGNVGAYWTCATVGTNNYNRFYLVNAMGFAVNNDNVYNSNKNEKENLHDANTTYPTNYISTNNEYGRCRGFSVRCVVDINNPEYLNTVN